VAKLSFKYVPPVTLAGVPPPAPAVPASGESSAEPAAAPRSFHESSWDLQHGLLVREDPPEDIPGDLFQALFGSSLFGS
jgi:hypothetical protein